MLVFFAACLLINSPGCAEPDEPGLEEDEFDIEANGRIYDPLEPLNRFFFEFNDKVYFWVVKPVAVLYDKMLPDDVQLCLRNFYHNLLTPVRLVNNILQGKIKNAGTELARFTVNSTLGVAGLGDPAKSEFGLRSHEEDFGQTLGVYGAGGGIYCCWPILGPSNLRDSFGMLADYFLDPLSYLFAANTIAGLGADALKEVNHAALGLGEYERFKEMSFDPYTAMRDAYQQHRRSKIRDMGNGPDDFSIMSQTNRTILKKAAGIDGPLTIIANYKHSPANAARTDRKVVRTVNRKGRPVDLARMDFFVHVGAFVDIEDVDHRQERLADLGKKTIITVHDLGDYFYYGIEVPSGSDFAAAKREEIYLARNGFPEAFVVAR